MYDKNQTYINVWDYKDKRYPFQIFIGGRGIGKTYSALKGDEKKGGALRALHDPDYKFIYARRTQEEIELIANSAKGEESANPFKTINKNEGLSLGFSKINKKICGLYDMVPDADGKLTPQGAMYGYGVAMSTVATMRSLDYSDCIDMLYDEFIPEAHVRKIKNEGDAILNAIETINRNREFDGAEPLNVFFISNSIDIYNALFVTLGIVNICEKMMKKGQEHYYDEDRALAIHILPTTEQFMEMKKKTALYRLTRGTAFQKSALDNQFAYNDFSLIGHRNLRGYQPICSVCNTAYIYKKKGSQELYITYARAKCPNFNVRSEQDRRAFVQRVGFAIQAQFISSNVIFESYELKELVLDLIL